MKSIIKSVIVLSLLIAAILQSCEPSSTNKNHIVVNAQDNIAFIGGNLCSRMINYSHFETAIHLAFPNDSLTIRNMCDGGDTPGFRPHSGRDSSWAFDGAWDYQDELAHKSFNVGHFEFPDEWLSRLDVNTIIAFFGYAESYSGAEGLENFRGELQAFVDHTLSLSYDTIYAPQLVLVSPIAFEDLSDIYDLPNGSIQNANLKLYSEVIKEVAAINAIPFIDAFSVSKKWFVAKNEMTIDGFQMTDESYELFAEFLVKEIFGVKSVSKNKDEVHAAVKEKNWFWHNDYKIPNGVHVFGRRYDPFGPDNYPFEFQKIREMTTIRDRNIWAVSVGKEFNLEEEDANTIQLPEVETNFKTGDYGRGDNRYLYGEEAENKIIAPSGYKVDLFASEEEFPDLANPVQLTFDNEGRLWVAVMPTYPHYKPGDPRPNDKLIILEDTDNDGKADKQTIAADNLHLPIGFELAPEGIYISQGTNLKILKDNDEDGYYESEEILLSGFDDHDTHHAISAFCSDPSGAIYMAEGVFLHTNVETPYGMVRAHNGGFYRYNPAKRHLERTSQVRIPNPWGIAFDDWGQPIYIETSGPAMRWMTASSSKPLYGSFNYNGRDLVREEDRVRPTSGLEFVSSRHFPDEVQGDILLNNSIGFLGTRQLKFIEDTTGFKTEYRQDLLDGSDPNFRPVDMEFAPDGSLYVVDWHNVLIGHMQHNARDPLRDHVHGRIYRVTYPSRPLVQPAKIIGASIPKLLDNLKLPEYRSRYRTRRELAGRNHAEVLSSLDQWVDQLDPNDEDFEKYQLEALWITWRLNKVDENLLISVLNSRDYRARAAAVKVLRYNTDKVSNYLDLLKKAANDTHSRPRLEAMTAASWLKKEETIVVLNEVTKHEMDDWLQGAYDNIVSHLGGKINEHRNDKKEKNVSLKGDDLAVYLKGQEIYEKDAYCATCHQDNGKGLASVGYPPLAGTEWVTGNQERLIKATLKGLHGPMTVLGTDYPGQVPMTPFEGLMTDDEIAAVLTYVRNSFGNQADPVESSFVTEIRNKVKGKEGFYVPKDLLLEHPLNGFSN